MESIIVIKIIFGIILSLSSFILILLAYLLFYKYLIQEEKCNKKTKGVIKKYTLFNYGGEHNNIHLPVVYYKVNNKDYKVVGPEYKVYISTMKKTPKEKNNISYEDKNQYLYTKRIGNILIEINKNPIEEMFPLGSKVDVYYYDKNPKIAYVLRYCNKKWMFWFMLISGIVILFLDLFIIFFL